MSRNGSGGYNLPAGNPVVTGTPISSTVMNNTLADIGTALAQSISQDGQTPITANLPMTGFRHTNVSDAQARTEYASAGQVQDGSLNLLTVSGTDTITATTTPAFTAYKAGMFFSFVAAGANTGAVTLNINGLGAKAVTKNGATPLAAGDIPSASAVSLIYDGTQFQVLGISVDKPGRLLAVRAFTSSGTYTPTTGTLSVIVEAVGGGGGSGGTSSTSATQFSISSGGGGGAYGRARFTSSFSGVSIAIGAGGAAGASGGGNAGNGGATSFGALMSCPGGSGGKGAGVVDYSTTSILVGGVGGGAPTGANLLGLPGEKAAESWQVSSSFACRGASGRSAMSTAIGQDMFGNSAAVAGTGYGGGAAGGFTPPSGTAQAGAAGAPGVVIVYEYA